MCAFKPQKTGETSACMRAGEVQGLWIKACLIAEYFDERSGVYTKREEDHGMSRMPCPGMQPSETWIQQERELYPCSQKTSIFFVLLKEDTYQTYMY